VGPVAELPQPSFDEVRLVSRAKQGDTGAFDQLVLRYQKRFFNLAYRMLSQADDALEVTQDAFYQMYRNLGRFEEKARFSTWGTRIVINLCLNLRKKKKRRNVAGQMSLDDTGPDEDQRPLSEVLPDEGESPEERLHRTELSQAIEEGLAMLNDIHREIVVLRDIQGQSYQEIAEALELNEGTVKSRLARARIALKDHIKKKL
jgi:RNA polymerase sigma-70 factor, ECF subfamily